MSTRDGQLGLFHLPPPQIDAAPPVPDLVALRNRLPVGIRLGTMSWSYPGWKGLVYGDHVVADHLPEHGLTAYAKHPLLRAVELDRTYYEPVAPSVLQAFGEQVPDDFRFLAKAHEDCTFLQFPMHARYGKKRGERNARFLDPSYAAEAVVGPYVTGLGSKAGVLLFQFPPQDAGDPHAFAEKLHAFLSRLPKGGQYAVELRNAELLTRSYAAALVDVGAVHCHNLRTGMPSLRTQANLIPPAARRPLLIRWLLRQGDRYDEAAARCVPFDKIVQEDPETREAIARLVVRADRHGVPAFVVVDNKAEGCAPESIVRLARAIADHPPA